MKCPKCFSELTPCAGKCSCGFDLEESSAVDLTALAADVPSEIPDLISMRQHPLWEEAYSTYPDHVKQLILLALGRNDPTALWRIGLMYGDGDGVEFDFGEAYRWLDLATKQGDIIALLCIGELSAMIADDCEERKGRDEERKWRRWAAAYNHIPSMERLMDGLLDMDTRRGREEALYWQFHLMIAEDDVAALTYEQVQRRLEEIEAYQDE